MLKVTVNGVAREGGARELNAWVAQQVDARRDDGVHVCVHVDVDAPGVHFSLASAGCGFGAGSRPLSPKEQAALDLWLKCGMNDVGFRGANVVEFLRLLRQLASVD